MPTKLRRVVVIVLTVALVLDLGAYASMRALGLDRVPDVESVMRSALPNDTLVFDRTGTVLLADVEQPGSQHTDVPLPAMGRWLPAATVAIDDPGFWSEPGVDPGRIARAAWDGLRRQPGGETGGTIVTRLIRLRLGTDDGLAARARAAALAVRVAAAVPKARILESYLNSLQYGNRAVGVEAAAITYFQVDAGQLDLAQASLIAGLPQAPNLLDPLHDLNAARARQRQVLDAMVRTHAITAREADQAFAEQLRVIGPANHYVAPNFVHQVLAELTSRYGQGSLSQPGFTVITTLDWGLQQQAELAVRQALDAAQGRGADSGALAAVDPRTGQVLALAATNPTGVPDTQLDLATRAVSPGTAFRVFTYAAAIAGRGFTMVTPVDDAPVTIQMGTGEPAYQPREFDARNHGVCALRTCAGNGLTVPAVRVELATGVPAVVATARALGAPPMVPHFEPSGSGPTYADDDPPASFGPSLTLGGYAETPLRMATGLATLAAGGVRHEPQILLQVTAAGGGSVLRAGADPGRQAFDPGAAFVVGQLLADDADRTAVYGSRSSLALPGRHAAALAGTGETYRDAWTAGYTPSLAAAVWMGSTHAQPMVPGSDGVFVAGPAWHRFMLAALDQMGRGDEWYQPPAGVQSAVVDGRPAWFLSGTSAGTAAPPMPASVHASG